MACRNEQRNAQDRPWTAVRFGSEHRRISRQNVENYIYRLHEFLNQRGANLRPQPTTDIVNTNDYIEARQSIEELIREGTVSKKLPLLLFIDDYNPPAKDNIVDDFREEIYVFNTRGDELEEMLLAGNFREAEGWCDEFVQECLQPSVQSSRDPSPAQEYPQEREQQQMIINFDTVVAAMNEFDRCSRIEQDDFIEIIAGPFLFNRLSNPFCALEENEKLLELLVKALESVFTKPNLEHANTLLLEVAERGFIVKIIEQALEYGHENVLYTSKLLMKLFLKTRDIVERRNLSHFNKAWTLFLQLLNAVPPDIWNSTPEAESWFKKGINKVEGKKDNDVEKELEPLSQGHKETYYDVSSEFFIQPYIDSETREPPEDFRTVSSYPTKGDLLSPTAIYLRRSIIEGPYRDADHYLDIQFRLFREDLVSPLRDGLSIHKQTGTSRYNRVSKVEVDGVEISDITLFDVQQVKGIQTRINHGDNFRYIQVATNSFLESVANRHLKYGQLIALSCDQFTSDIHIGIIVERNDNDLLSNGLLGIHFIFDGGLDMKKGYVLAEPSSYLEMYSHVLKVMQTINQLSPLPMERYLVQVKTNRRRPRYLRQAQDEANDEDDKLEKQYIEKFYRKQGRKTLNSDSEPEFDRKTFVPKRKCISLAEPQNKEYIKFRGRLYKIDNLEEELEIEDYDISQRKALISALTSELALIQGPPGTGKTFIGVEIVRTILENRICYGLNEPILLVCYTNAALDQFLEKILDKVSVDVEQKRYAHNGPIAVRLGLKSDSSKLERAGVMKKDIIARYKDDYAIDEEQEVKSKNKQKRLAAASLATASYIVSQEAQREILTFDALKDIIPVGQMNEMLSWAVGKKDSKQEMLAMDEVMACWLLDKSLEDGPADLLPLMDVDDKEDFVKANPRRAFVDDEDNITLDVVFQQMNKIADEHQARLRELWNKRDDFEKQYETEDKWDILKRDLSMTKNVVMFSDGGNKRISDYRRIVEVPYDQIIVTELTDAKNNILDASPLTEQEAGDIRSIYGLPKQRRWQLYNYWSLKLRAKVKQQIPGFIKNYQTICEKAHKAIKQQDAAILSKSLIIGATTTGAAKFRDLLELIGCRIVMIEEAAEVLEAHTFASLLPSIEHAVLIGDHQQLRPNPSVYELSRTYNMDVSLFERLIKNGAPFDTLEKQHRMHPDITKTIVRPHFYTMLKDADEVKEYSEVSGMKQRLFFWSHSHAENTGFDGVSYSNPTEIDMVMSLIQYIRKQGYGFNEVTVIATYSAQVEAIKQKVLAKFGTTAANSGPAISVETVDSFQGKENKIIIVSLVRSQGNTIGFLQTANRICVALTRAQHGMYIVGNGEHLAAKSKLWNRIYASLQSASSVGNTFPIKCRPHKTVQYIGDPSEFEIKSPDGGCNETCGYDLTCGHKCGRKCHPVDDHASYQCQAACTRTCKNKSFSHECFRRCYEDCGLCQHIEAVTLKCGHVTNVPCHAADKAQCVEQCEEILSCNHRCRELCSRPCKTNCKEEIAIDFPCGHVLIAPCNYRKRQLRCQSTCEEILSCGHQCQELCGEICTTICMKELEQTLKCGHLKIMACSKNPEVQVCDYPVYRPLTCGHECDVPCYSGDDRKYCNKPCCAELPCGHFCEGKCGECFVNGKHICPEPCKKSLKCGHHCNKRCGEKCGDCVAECNNGCTHLTCGIARKRLNPASVIFNRNCNQQCILCTSRCDNTCMHRSCQRRCYEPCDIKPCDQACSLQLKCSHACLGMCGEECPDLCGTCSRKQYRNLLIRNNLSENEFHHLIYVPLCGHIIPVKIMDEYVTQLTEEKTMPRCKVCEGSLNGVKRYAKIVKKITLDAYYAKERVCDQACSAHATLMTSKMAVKDLQELQIKNSQKEYGTFKNIMDLRALNSLITNITNDINQEIAEGSRNMAVLKDLALFLQCLCKMYSTVWDCCRDYGKNIVGPHNVLELFDGLISRRQIFNATRTTLDDCRKNLESIYKLKLRGAIVPNARYLFYKALFNLTIWKFAYFFSKCNRKTATNQADLTSNQLRELKNIAKQFRQCTYGDEYSKQYARFLQYLNEKILSSESQIKFDFVLPDF